MSKTFANSINSNPLYAERAEQDASGNTITTTYATKSEVSAVADVPDVTSSDNGKVLKATYEGGAGSYAWANETGTTYTAGDGVGITNNVISADVDGTTIGIDSTTKKIKLLSTIPTVDQTYNASSTNAQSGTAVASAIAAVPTKPIVAGSNITITDNTNNVTISATVPTVDEVPAVTSSDDGKVLTATYSGGTGSYAWASPGGGSGSDIFWAEYGQTSFNDIWTAVSAEKTVYLTGAGELPTSSTGTVTYARLQYIEKSSWGGVLSKAIFVRTTGSGNASKLNAEITAFTVDGNDTWTSGYTQGCLLPMPSINEAGKVLKVDSSGDAEWASISIDEVPAVTSSDDGKVLKATYSGGTGSYAWATASGGTTYSAGNMIAIDSNNNNAIGVSTTAGITDIQQVASLPANPVSTVLYLIPET